MGKGEETLNLVKYKSHSLYRDSYKVDVMLDLFMCRESDAFIAGKHGLDLLV